MEVAFIVHMLIDVIIIIITIAFITTIIFIATSFLAALAALCLTLVTDWVGHWLPFWTKSDFWDFRPFRERQRRHDNEQQRQPQQRQPQQRQRQKRQQQRRQSDKNRRRQRPKREFNIVASGQFRTLAMFGDIVDISRIYCDYFAAILQVILHWAEIWWYCGAKIAS